LSLLNASSSSSLVSVMESSGLKSPWSSNHSFHALPLGKSLSAFFCRLTLLKQTHCRERLNGLTHCLLVQVNSFFLILFDVISHVEWSNLFRGQSIFEVGIQTCVHSLFR
jgi:hypothetical protein